MRIDVLMFEGVAEIDALATYAVFANAQRRGLAVEPYLVTADGATQVTGCYGTTFAELVPWAPESARVLAVSGGWVLEEIERGVIPRQLAEAKAAGGEQLVLAGIDSGSLLLGAAGLIAGRPATTHRADLERLAEWAEVIDARVVDDGDLVTCGSGWFAGTDLAYWLLERELGATAEVVALEQWIGRDRQGTVWRR
ncbi:ThiJ/PfpI domain protein [Kribbella flavida DSM 17836]|uniref:ThiJ/PfpI domain protein n=1 Tax=Kribbella flavida (strain DSM 17836 / JCM 10339 / NBRC 14399) TaxID=479435 RepID=D2PWW4_KRIFD|nr:DJ-1/PfpI family protein [Kribbella flavida]ADB35344.1 ThiJ/PfpI domain protein [Kribbella flavida DSM 17836]